MAHYSNALSFLLVQVLFLSLQIEARESKFFSKAIIHYNTNTTTNNATVSSHVHQVERRSPSPLPWPSSSPSPLMSPSGAPAVPVESDNGCGLHGQGATEFPNTFDDSEIEIPALKFKEESNNEYLNNNRYPNNYNEHAYVTVPQGLRFMENGKNFYNPKFPHTTTKTTGIPNDENQVAEENLYEELNYIKKNNVYTNSFNENAYVSEPQGLIDPRFMENGKYYDDPKNERNYKLVKESRDNNNDGYYGNNHGEKSKYEFDSMEEYERQEGYPQTDQGD